MSDTLTNRRRLLHYIAEIRRQLRLDNWDVVLHADHVDPEEEAHAETWQNENHYVLNIRLSPDFFDLEPDGIRNVVIHELTHVQHRDVNRVWNRASSTDAVPASVSEGWNEDYFVHMERFVTWVADRLESSMPPWDPTASVPKQLPTGCYLHSRPS